MKEALRHLVQCHCILPQYRKRKDPIFHKFVVFSIIENDKVEEKLAQCPNCNIVHKIVDICKSEIVSGKDEASSIVDIDDLKISLPDKIIRLLESYNADLSIWEHVSFILDEELWGLRIKLTSDEADDEVVSKFLLFKSESSFKVETESSLLFLKGQ